MDTILYIICTLIALQLLVCIISGFSNKDSYIEGFIDGLIIWSILDSFDDID